MPQFLYSRRSFAYSVKSCRKNILLLHFVKCACQPGRLSKYCAVTSRKRSQSWVLAYELGIGIKIRATLQTESIWKQDMVRFYLSTFHRIDSSYKLFACFERRNLTCWHLCILILFKYIL